MNLRRTQNGSFEGETLFKVRRISTGEFFKPEYRNPKWEAAGGRVYKTVNAARTAAGSARLQPGLGTTLVPPEDLEVVEYHVVEHTAHMV